MHSYPPSLLLRADQPRIIWRAWDHVYFLISFDCHLNDSFQHILGLLSLPKISSEIPQWPDSRRELSSLCVTCSNSLSHRPSLLKPSAFSPLSNATTAAQLHSSPTTTPKGFSQAFQHTISHITAHSSPKQAIAFTMASRTSPSSTSAISTKSPILSKCMTVRLSHPHVFLSKQTYDVRFWHG